MTKQEFIEKYKMMEEEDSHLKKEVKMSIISKLSNVQVLVPQSEREYLDHIKKFVMDYFEIESPE